MASDQFTRDARDEVARLFNGTKAPAYAGLSDGLAADISEHNRNVAGDREAVAEAFASFDAAIANAPIGDYGDLFAAITTTKASKAEFAQTIAARWKRKGELIARARNEFSAKRPERQAELDRVAKTVAAELTRIGNGLEAQPSYGTDADAAEAQFATDVRKNVNVRKAQAALDDVDAEIAATVEHGRLAAEGMALAHKFVVRTARHLAGV